jgi:hypothetical protein
LVGFKNSTVAKYWTLFGWGLPSGLSSRPVTRSGKSWGWQFNTQAVCSAVKRAGN